MNNSNFNTKVENGKPPLYPTNNIERPFFISPTNNNFHKFGVKVNNSNPSVKNDINCIQFGLNNKPEPLDGGHHRHGCQVHGDDGQDWTRCRQGARE